MPAHVVLALLSAASWGASDFLGGMAERRSPGAPVALGSQLVGLVALLPVAALTASSVQGRDLAWGMAAGAGGAVGVSLLYRGLAAGMMSIVAPVTAVAAATVPVAFGLVTGERPGPVALTGVVLALVAVAVLCASPGRPQEEVPPAVASGWGPPAVAGGRLRAATVDAVLSGTGFGLFFICLDRAGSDAGLWPIVAARSSAVALLGAVLVATGRTAKARELGAGVAGVGVLDVLANVLYLLASRRGLLSVTALLASLYPAATVVLARVVLGERLSGAQAAGLAGAAAAVGLIVLS